MKWLFDRISCNKGKHDRGSRISNKRDDVALRQASQPFTLMEKNFFLIFTVTEFLYLSYFVIYNNIYLYSKTIYTIIKVKVTHTHTHSKCVCVSYVYICYYFTSELLNGFG